MDESQLRALGKELRHLQQTTPLGSDGLEDWHSKAQHFAESFRAVDGLELPAIVWRYLSDADMRVKDPEYRERQDSAVLEVITALESGVVPPIRDVILPPLPVIAVIGALVVVAGYFLFKWLAA